MKTDLILFPDREGIGITVIFIKNEVGRLRPEAVNRKIKNGVRADMFHRPG